MTGKPACLSRSVTFFCPGTRARSAARTRGARCGLHPPMRRPAASENTLLLIISDLLQHGGASVSERSGLSIDRPAVQSHADQSLHLEPPCVEALHHGLFRCGRPHPPWVTPDGCAPRRASRTTNVATAAGVPCRAPASHQHDRCSWLGARGSWNQSWCECPPPSRLAARGRNVGGGASGSCRAALCRCPVYTGPDDVTGRRHYFREAVLPAPTTDNEPGRAAAGESKRGPGRAWTRTAGRRADLCATTGRV